MARRVKHYLLPPDELLERIHETGLTPSQFAKLFDVNRKTMSRWLAPLDSEEAADPPYWVTVALDLLRLPGAIDRVEQLHATHMMDKGDAYS